MRKFAKLLIPALLVVAVIVSCAIMFASADAGSGKVVYVSMTGTGDGSSASSPIGPGVLEKRTNISVGSGAQRIPQGTTYAQALEILKGLEGKKISGAEAIEQLSPLSRAAAALGDEGGTIVLVDEVRIEMARTLEKGFSGYIRFDKGSGSDATPSCGPVTITSTGNGKLVIDHTRWDSIDWYLWSNVTLKDLAVEYRYNGSMYPFRALDIDGNEAKDANGNPYDMDQRSYKTGFNIYLGTYDFTVDTGVTVTSKNYASGTPVDGNIFPNIMVGRCGGTNETNSTITIKSGTWGSVYSAGHGISEAGPGVVVGNTTINVMGGKVNAVCGGGVTPHNNRNFAELQGNAVINITGGSVGTVYAVSGKGVTGTSTITIEAPAQVSRAAYKHVVVGRVPTVFPTSTTLTYRAGTLDAANIIEFEDSMITVLPAASAPTATPTPTATAAPSTTATAAPTATATARPTATATAAPSATATAAPSATATGAPSATATGAPSATATAAPSATTTPKPVATPPPVEEVKPSSSKVIYVSMTGTGDGSSANSPLGPGLVTDEVTNAAATNAKVHTKFTNSSFESVMTWLKENKDLGKMEFTDDALTKAHPLYRAAEKLGAEGGTIVIVGTFTLEAAKTFENGYAGDFKLPETGAIAIKGGDNAKLILDHSTWNSTSMWLGGATSISDIAMEYRYDSAYQLSATNTASSTYMPGFTFYANGFDFTIGSGVTVVSKDYSGSAPVDGDRFPNIFGGTRNVPEMEANPVITVKSGTWALVAAAGHSVSAAKDSSIAGNVVINIAGGKIENVNGAGVSPFLNRQFATIYGDVTIRVTGGEVEFITCVTGGGIEGKLLIDLDGGKVGDIFYKETRNTSALDPETKAIVYRNGTIDLANIDAEFAAAEISEKTDTPQTGSPIAWLSVVAVLALAGASVVISKKRTRIED